MTDTASDIARTAHEWDRAMVTNDPEAIGRYMADDWIIIGSDGRTMDKSTFLDLLRAGTLTHDEMSSEDLLIRVYGDTAVVITRSVSGGLYTGHRFREIERTSNVFVQQQQQWRCVLTHLSRLADPGA
jgi:ketosteroid isomerase-like protein